MLRHLRVLALIAAAAAAPAKAADPEITPGQYVREGDSGTLTVRPGKQNRLTFQIESLGGNCHACSVKGVIMGAVGHGDGSATDPSSSKCRISFSDDRSAVAVHPITAEACSEYCGARAGFDGTYRIPPPVCTSAGRKKLRDQFLQSYRARRFADATETLQGLIAQCRQFMGRVEMDQVRNDLALAQHHGGDSQQCLATLNDTLAAQAKGEAELKEGVGNVYLPPCEFDNYIKVAKATWFNKALCTKAAAKAR